MKIYMLTIFFMMCLLSSVNAQSYLLVEKQGSIMLVNYSPTNIKYGGICGDGEIELMRSDGYNFVGYNWATDTLILFLERNGIVRNIKLKLADDIDIPFRDNVQEYNLERFWRNTNDNKISYRIDEYTIIRDMEKSGIRCYKGDTLLWAMKNNIRSTGIGFTSSSPVYASRRKTLLFQNALGLKEGLIEIDIQTGKKTHLIKNSGDTYFDYSGNGEYVLCYDKRKRISIYDIANKKSAVFIGWKKAYRLYR